MTATEGAGAGVHAAMAMETAEAGVQAGVAHGHACPPCPAAVVREMVRARTRHPLELSRSQSAFCSYARRRSPAAESQTRHRRISCQRTQSAGQLTECLTAVHAYFRDLCGRQLGCG